MIKIEGKVKKIKKNYIIKITYFEEYCNSKDCYIYIKYK